VFAGISGGNETTWSTVWLGPVFKFARRKADNDYGYDYVDDPVFVCVPS